MRETICRAITERRLLMFAYAGQVRVAEPHLLGRTTAEHDAMSAWMRPGWSRTDPDGAWRMFRLDSITNLEILPETFSSPRADYNRDDPHFVDAYCRL